MFFRHNMQKISIAKDFLKKSLPQVISERANWDSLRCEKTSMIDDEYKEHCCDVLYALDIDNRSAYVYTLIEHKSYPDRLVCFQLLKYMINIMDHHLKQQSEEKKKRVLPLVVPLLIYHGRQSPYPFSTLLWDLFYDPNLAKQIYFNPFTLIDYTVLANSEIEAYNRAKLMVRLQRDIFKRDFLPVLEALINEQVLQQFVDEFGDNEFTPVVIYILATAHLRNEDRAQKLLEYHFPNQREKIMTFAQQMKDEGIAEGMAVGMAEGIAEGMTRSQRAIAKHLLAENLDIRLISKTTKLSIADIKTLATEFETTMDTVPE